MKKKLLTLPIVLLFVFGLLSVSMTGVSAVAYPSVYVDPASTGGSTYIVGTLFTVAIKTNYTGNDIWGYEFTLTYDPSILKGVEVTNGGLIYTTTLFVSAGFDNDVGKLGLTGNAFLFIWPPAPLTSGPGILAYVTFKAVGHGTSDITIGPETKLKGVTNGGYGSKYNIIDAETMPDQIGHGYFDNTDAPEAYMPLAVITASDEEYINEPVTFSGEGSSDPDGTAIISYEWGFGDGTTGTGATIDKTYTTAGIYTVTLVVTDEQNQVSEPAVHSIILAARPPYAADLVKWKVKSEKSHWVESKDSDGMVTLTALTINLGTNPVLVEVTFVIIDAASGTSVGVPLVVTDTLEVGPDVNVPKSVDLDPYLYGYDGTKKVLYAHVTLRYDSSNDGTCDTATKPKAVRFAVCP